MLMSWMTDYIEDDPADKLDDDVFDDVFHPRYEEQTEKDSRKRTLQFQPHKRRFKRHKNPQFWEKRENQCFLPKTDVRAGRGSFKGPMPSSFIDFGQKSWIFGIFPRLCRFMPLGPPLVQHKSILYIFRAYISMIDDFDRF